MLKQVYEQTATLIGMTPGLVFNDLSIWWHKNQPFPYMQQKPAYSFGILKMDTLQPRVDDWVTANSTGSSVDQ